MKEETEHPQLFSVITWSQESSSFLFDEATAFHGDGNNEDRRGGTEQSILLVSSLIPLPHTTPVKVI